MNLKAVRLASVRYPGGRLVQHAYGSGDLNDAISRLESIKDDAPTPAVLASYQYNGLASLVVEDFPQPHLRLDYANDYAGGSRPVGTYEGLDRFGRVRQQVWRHYGAGSYADRFSYGYDFDSNRLYRKNEVNTALSELYHENNATANQEYDGLNRLVRFRRGTLASDSRSITSNVTRRQEFTLDGLGNWSAFKDATNANTWLLEQTRLHNKANEIDTDNNHANTPGNAIAASVGANWIDPTYDPCGNMVPGAEPARLVHVMLDPRWGAGCRRSSPGGAGG